MSGKQTNIKKIPYGISDYEKIITGNYYYVDKTPFLKTIEATGDYLFFIRPRRFGKSLLLSLMETYYDIGKKDRFGSFFQDTAVFREPTDERNSYLILKFNFSAINPNIDNVENSFLNYTLEVGESFISTYHSLLNIDEGKRIGELKSKRTAPDVLRFLVWLCRKSSQRLFVIIDEYDNFANTILSTSGSNDYQSLTHGEGFFRTFFNVLKEGTSGSGAPISRLFLTGVSPITLDDVTSGYNIGKNVSVEPLFHQLLGFTEHDVVEMIEYYRAKGQIRHDTDELLDIMGQWYNHYAFSKEPQTTLFNPAMVFFFLDGYFSRSTIPEELIDRNVRIDYDKIRHLLTIDRRGKKEANGNFSRLREIIEEERVASKLKSGFPLEEMELPENFTSLLFYFGMLTISGQKNGLTLFQIPNRTVRHLFYDYIIRVGQDTGLVDINTVKLTTLLYDMAYHGNWHAFFEYISERLGASASIRDLIREEKVIQGFLLAYLGISDYFVTYSEKELNRGYADIVMEPFLPGYAGIRYSYIIEIKYIKPGQARDEKSLNQKVQRLKMEAESQLKQYALDEKFKKAIGSTTLIKLVLIFSGAELKYIAPVRGK